MWKLGAAKDFTSWSGGSAAVSGPEGRTGGWESLEALERDAGGSRGWGRLWLAKAGSSLARLRETSGAEGLEGSRVRRCRYFRWRWKSASIEVTSKKDGLFNSRCAKLRLALAMRSVSLLLSVKLRLWLPRSRASLSCKGRLGFPSAYLLRARVTSRSSDISASLWSSFLFSPLIRRSRSTHS